MSGGDGWDATLAFTVHMNGYRDGSVEDITLTDLTEEQISVISELTGVSGDWMAELQDEGKAPCRQCGDIIKKGPNLPPVCQPCLRGDTDV